MCRPVSGFSRSRIAEPSLSTTLSIGVPCTYCVTRLLSYVCTSYIQQWHYPPWHTILSAGTRRLLHLGSTFYQRPGHAACYGFDIRFPDLNLVTCVSHWRFSIVTTPYPGWTTGCVDFPIPFFFVSFFCQLFLSAAPARCNTPQDASSFGGGQGSEQGYDQQWTWDGWFWIQDMLQQRGR